MHTVLPGSIRVDVCADMHMHSGPAICGKLSLTCKDTRPQHSCNFGGSVKGHELCTIIYVFP